MITRRAVLAGSSLFLAPRMLRAAPSDPAPALVADGLAFPEGLCPHPNGDLLFVEIAGGRLSRLRSGKVEVVAELGGGPNGCALGPDGQAYVANNGGLTFRRSAAGRLGVSGVPETYRNGSIERVDLKTGRAETLYTHCGGVPLKGPNDLVFDGSGGFWFTDTGKIRRRDRDLGGLYWARSDGSAIREVVFPLNAPNGIALSADRSRVIVALSDKRQLISYDIIAPGVLRSGPVGPLATVIASPPGPFSIDNIAVQDDGGVVISAVGEGAVLDLDASGSVRGKIRLNDPVVTCVAFARNASRKLYAAMSGAGQIVALDWPRGGVTPVYP